MESPLQLGIDILLEASGSLKNQRLALVTNDAALTGKGIPVRTALLENGFQVKKLFSPEHGISRLGEDGAPQPNSIDPLTGLPIISLYGHKMAPIEADLAEIDAVLFDIPDIGCRFYTYLWTMTHVMEACARYQKRFILTDRPNPIGALLSDAEGPMLNEAHCSSFVGRWNIPVKHACTLGELCRFFAEKRIKNLQFDIIRLKNYNRAFTAANYGFTPTSPAMKDVETALLYPGMGLLEGINVNEGRGTSTPFKKCGTSWLNNGQLLQKMQKLDIPGIEFKTTEYVPETGLYAGETCNGLEWRLTRPEAFRAVKTGILLLQAIIELHPEQVTKRLYTTHANPTGSAHLNKLLGHPNAFERLKKGEAIETDLGCSWMETIKPFLLY